MPADLHSGLKGIHRYAYEKVLPDGDVQLQANVPKVETRTRLRSKLCIRLLRLLKGLTVYLHCNQHQTSNTEDKQSEVTGDCYHISEQFHIVRVAHIEDVTVFEDLLWCAWGVQ